jgi:hypothetical protein
MHVSLGGHFLLDNLLSSMAILAIRDRNEMGYLGNVFDSSDKIDEETIFK